MNEQIPTILCCPTGCYSNETFCVVQLVVIAMGMGHCVDDNILCSCCDKMWPGCVTTLCVCVVWQVVAPYRYGKDILRLVHFVVHLLLCLIMSRGLHKEMLISMHKGCVIDSHS